MTIMEGMKFVFERAKEENVCAFVAVKLPGQETLECIVNHPDALDNKLAYYNRAYTEDGVLRTNPEIKIMDVGMLDSNIMAFRVGKERKE